MLILVCCLICLVAVNIPGAIILTHESQKYRIASQSAVIRASSAENITNPRSSLLMYSVVILCLVISDLIVCIAGNKPVSSTAA